MKPTGALSSSLSSSSNKLESDFEQTVARLKAVFGIETDTDLGRKLGLSQGAISAAKLKKAVPPGWITAVALNNGISADWLLTGEGEMMRGPSAPGRPGQDAPDQMCIYNDMEPATPLVQAGRTVTCTDCELVMIPLVEARLSAGNGSFETSADSERRYAFRADFLRRKGSPNAMILMRVAGESMEPKIEHGDVVLIDTSQTTPRLGSLYAVAVEDLVYLKMVNAEPGKLILSSANPAYAPLEIDARGDLTKGIRIIGKAVWVGRELD